jgi:hypothetical protein
MLYHSGARRFRRSHRPQLRVDSEGKVNARGQGRKRQQNLGDAGAVNRVARA